MRRFAAPRSPVSRRLLAGGLCTAALALALGTAARAQIALPGAGGRGAPLTRNEPVTFRADKVDYDSHNGLVTWTGHVEIWQNDHILRADKVTFDRNTNVAAASGNVAMVEPDGEVLFADYAELTQGLRDGVMTNMRAILASDGKLAANGARRTEGKVNDLSRAVYTACKVCAEHPEKPAFWELRAYDATQDVEHKRIEYRDAYLDLMGIPVGYLPYYWVLNRSSDVTLIPLIATDTGPQLTAAYRARLNEGIVRITGAVAYDTNKQDGFVQNGNTVAPANNHGVQGYVYSRFDFSLNQYWRYGANVNLASSANYLRDYRISGYGADTLNSNAFLEGFGTGAYSRLDVQAFQGLNSGVINQSELPFVLPRYIYSYFGEPDALGGRFSLNTSDFNLYRANGTSDERGQLTLNWDRPFKSDWGQLYTLTLHMDSEVYNARKLDLVPNYYAANAATSGQVLPTVALKMNWPFLRPTSNGSQLIEPIVQAIAAPNSGNSATRLLPNEDSLDYEFTDTTLFSLNRHEGVDRLDGGARINAGLHGNWTFGGRQIDALVGESFQSHIQENQVPNSGLLTHASDIVGRVLFAPASWLDFTARARIDHQNGNVHFADGLVNIGPSLLHLSGGYIYSSDSIYYYYSNNFRLSSPPAQYFQPTNEGTIGLSSSFRNWRVSGYGRRDLANNRFVALGADAAYSNDCFMFDVSFNRRYTNINGDTGDTSVLFTLTFKTLGTFPVNG